MLISGNALRAPTQLAAESFGGNPVALASVFRHRLDATLGKKLKIK
jgi:hypothetical protein